MSSAPPRCGRGRRPGPGSRSCSAGLRSRAFRAVSPKPLSPWPACPGISFLPALAAFQRQRGDRPGAFPGPATRPVSASTTGRDVVRTPLGDGAPQREGPRHARHAHPGRGGSDGGPVPCGSGPTFGLPRQGTGCARPRTGPLRRRGRRLPTASTAHADVVLPAAIYTERRGSFTNIEGRITWLGQKVTAPGTPGPTG